MAADIVLIPIFGAAGAAWGTVLAESAVLAIQFCFCRKDLSWNRPGRDAVLYCGRVAHVYQRQRDLNPGDGWAVLIVACLTGIVLYALICMLPVLYEKRREEGGSRTWRKKVKYSFIIPVYNREAYIVRCLDSIHHQTKKDVSFEVIVVDDGSTDETAKECRSILRKNPLLLHSSQ